MLTTVGLDKKEVLQDVGFLLPSDIIDFVMRQDKSVANSSFFSEGAAEVLKFWLNEDPDHIDRLRLQEEEFALTLPICWHEDAVPHSKTTQRPFTVGAPHLLLEEPGHPDIVLWACQHHR